MNSADRLAQLRSDIVRWRERLSDAESTYCQGVASKAAKDYEALLKSVAERRLVVAGGDLHSLLAEIGYGGAVSAIAKLPLGTTSDLVARLAKYDSELATALPPATRNLLTKIVELRNDTTHELPPQEMRVATEVLLDSIDSVLRQLAGGALL